MAAVEYGSMLVDWSNPSDQWLRISMLPCCIWCTYVEGWSSVCGHPYVYDANPISQHVKGTSHVGQAIRGATSTELYA
jgi:hypothetical protein